MVLYHSVAKLLLCLNVAFRAEATLTQAQKTAVVNKHNDLRSNVASASTAPCTAADMEKMTWDDTLATAAQAYSEQCLFGVHQSPMQPTGAGENLAMMQGAITDTSVVSWTEAWYSEVADVVWSSDRLDVTAATRASTSDCVQAEGGGCVIGHYTAVVWASTNKVGCGAHVCSTFTNFVCKYSPGGNVGSYAPWLVGTPCSACGGTSGGSCENNLCTNPSNVVRCADDRTMRYNGVDYTQCSAMFTAAASTYQNLCAGSFGSSQSICEQAASYGCAWTNGACGVSATKGQEAGCDSTSGMPAACPLSCGTCSVPSGVGTCSGSTSSGGSSGGNSNSGGSGATPAPTHGGSGATPAPTPAPTTSDTTLPPAGSADGAFLAARPSCIVAALSVFAGGASVVLSSL